MPTFEFTERELTTILVALRYWQRDAPEQIDSKQWDLYFDNPKEPERNSPLDTDEIDELCEAINSCTTS